MNLNNTHKTVLTLKPRRLLLAALLLGLGTLSAIAQPASLLGHSPVATLPPGVAIDLEAKNVVGGDGTIVNQWLDSSGNGYNAWEHLGNHFFVTNSATHKAVHGLAGITDGFVITNAAALGLLQNVGGATIVCTVTSDTLANAHVLGLFSTGTGASSTSRASVQMPETGGNSNLDPRGRRLDADSGQTLLGPGIVNGVRYVVAVTFNYASTSLTSYTNNVQLATTGSFQTAGNTQNTPSLAVAVMWDGTANTFEGNFENFLAWPRVLSGAELTQAYNYLK